MILFAFQLNFKATLHCIPGDILLHDINVPAIPDVLLKLREILTTHFQFLLQIVKQFGR